MPLNGNSSARPPRRWWVTGLAILVAVIVLAAFVTHKDDSIPVRTAQVERGQIRSLISTNGKIEPVQNFEAHSPMTTTVRRVLVKEGDSVKKGQLLVALDDADARTQAARAQTQMKIAAAEINALEPGRSPERRCADGEGAGRPRGGTTESGCTQETSAARCSLGGRSPRGGECSGAGGRSTPSASAETNGTLFQARNRPRRGAAPGSS